MHFALPHTKPSFTSYLSRKVINYTGVALIALALTCPLTSDSTLHTCVAHLTNAVRVDGNSVAPSWVDEGAVLHDEQGPGDDGSNEILAFLPRLTAGYVTVTCIKQWRDPLCDGACLTLCVEAGIEV